MVVQKRTDDRNAKWKAERVADDDIRDQAEKLAKRLGFGEPHYHIGYRLDTSGWAKALVLTFAEVEEIIKQLKG